MCTTGGTLVLVGLERNSVFCRAVSVITRNVEKPLANKIGLILLVGFLPFLSILLLVLPFLVSQQDEKFIAGFVILVYLILIFQADALLHWVKQRTRERFSKRGKSEKDMGDGSRSTTKNDR